MIPYDAPVVERGVGFFETMLVLGSRVSLFDEHVERLQRTMRGLDLPLPSIESLTDRTRVAMTAAPRGEKDEAALRITWAAVGKELSRAEAWRLDVSVRPIPPLTMRRRQGCHAISLPLELQRDCPGYKSTSYLGAVLGLRAADRAGADEGFFRTEDGRYLEGTAAQVVAFRDGILTRAERGALPSATADAFAKHTGLREERRPLERGELVAGALMVGSLTCAAPLVTLDGVPCTCPPAMMKLISDFNAWLVASARTV